MARDAVHGQPVSYQAWPPRLRPERSDVYAHNELISPAPADRLWAWLIRARGWSTWYANCRGLRIENGGRKLQEGSRFRWETFQTTITSTVDVFEPSRALGWRWDGSTAKGYHIWLLEPFAVDGGEVSGTRILTEESQQGLGPRLIPFVLGPALRASHGLWLRALSARGQQLPRRDS